MSFIVMLSPCYADLPKTFPAILILSHIFGFFKPFCEIPSNAQSFVTGFGNPHNYPSAFILSQIG